MKYPQSLSMPSAVSDWLEEQLEARGIDAVVYTRYILSLLHTHTIDVIYPDEDLQFSRLRKEVGRSAGARKRFRRTSDWWRHAQADAEQIKRSAAVECLMSASDQNCEIESLVDELCEKLKEVDSHAVPDLSNVKEPPAQKISPKELAEKYYAAFPPLCPANETIVTLLPKWLPNPSPKKSKRKTKRQPYDNKFHSETMRQRTGPSRQRFGLKKQSCVRNLSKEISDNITNWSLCEKNEDQRCLPTRNDPDDDVHMYDDLPVDISELLEDSPSLSPHEETVDLMNMANMRDTGRNNGFISCGTNIISSIWSNNDQNKIENENSLDLKFSSISIDAATSWPDFDKQNETNAMLEKKKTSVFEVFHGLSDVWGGKDVKNADLPFENEHLFDRHTVSLMKLNHSKERSGFVEISPKTKCNTQTFNPFGQSSSLFCFNRKNITLDKEDLLTSERSHFKPINEKTQGEYEDGATFVINNKLDKVEYRRSESGSMYLQNEFGQTKKYREYKNESDEEFVLKYCVVQNDKSCQTEEVTMEDGCPIISGRVFLGNQEAMDDAELDCEVDEFCCSTSNRADSVLGEVTWKYELKSCDKCNNNNVVWDTEWNGRKKIGSEWDCDSLRNIWDGGKVCNSCLRLNGGCTPPTTQNNQLREDISQDGEQLLSDLSSLQKCYMENMPIGDYEVLPYEERKRRRSFMEDGAQNGSSWSFASRLAEDCLITMSTMPTLRSVTL